MQVYLDLYSCIHNFILFIYLFGALRRFQHCTGHITTGSWMGRGNQYIKFVRVLYCKLPTNAKQLPAFPLEAVTGIKPRPQRWEARVLPLCHRGPLPVFTKILILRNNLSLRFFLIIAVFLTNILRIRIFLFTKILILRITLILRILHNLVKVIFEMRRGKSSISSMDFEFIMKQ